MINFFSYLICTLVFFFFCYSFSLTVSCYRHRLRTYLLSSALVCPVVPSHFIDCYNGSVWVCLLTFSGSLPLLIYIHIKCLSKWKPPELLQGLQGNMRATQLHATKLHVHLFDCSYLQTELNQPVKMSTCFLFLSNLIYHFIRRHLKHQFDLMFVIR